jgi:MFS family permease
MMVPGGSAYNDASGRGTAAAVEARTGAQVAAPAEPWPSPAQGWYAIFIFALSLVVSFLDRTILSLLVEPIKRDLHLTEVQVSLLMGFAFVCVYTFTSLPVARLADYKSRRAIIGIAIATWSMMTALCGTARSFAQLFLFRVGVGAGEAWSGPATYSMIADLFPREKLARAAAVLNFGTYTGNGLALIIGGTLTHLLLVMPPKTLPVFGTVYGWQLTFIAVGLPGLIVAALMRTVKEPKRRGVLGGSSGTANGVRRAVPIRDLIRFLKDNAGIYLPMLAGMGINTMMAFGISTWGPAFYIRTFHWTPAQFGLAQGIITLTILPLGAVTGGYLAERFAKQGHDDANLRVVLLASILALPGSILFPLMPTAAAALAVSAYASFVGGWSAGPLNAALQTITPNQMRGQVTSLYLLTFNLIGFGVGPTMVALFTQYVFHSDAMVGHSMSAVATLLGPIGVLIWILTRKPYARSIQRAKAWS